MSKLHNVRDRITYISSHAKQEHYLDEAKRFYTDLINLLIEDDKDKLHVFDKNGLYLATKKIGKNNPKAEQIKENNEVRMQWNHEVDRALVSQVPEDEIRQIKQKWITERIRLSIDVFGKCPEKLAGIITTATAKLALLISKILTAARLTKKKEFENRIATKTEEIRTLKAGLSGIVRQHGFATVQDFYTAFYTAQRVTDAYQKECAKWDKSYGEKATPKAESMHEKLQRYQEKADRQNASQPYLNRDKGAR